MFALGKDRWLAVSRHLDEALDVEAPQRAAWLESFAVRNPTVAADLRVLLEEYEALNRKGFLEQGPTPMPRGSLAGQTIGAYTLIAPIGDGGMGAVWLADRSDGRFTGRAAVKLLNVPLIGGSGGERFLREGTFLARLSHPNIAHLTDAGVSSFGQPYLVLEYVAGRHIDRYCDANRLTVEARIRLFLDVLAAVNHAHANLIVHRDIKPSNVLVSDDGQVKLLDFGIAKLLEPQTHTAGATLTREGGRALTPEYAAPEQLTGEPITTVTDVYALGVLLYVLLGGQHPTTRSSTRTPTDLLKAIAAADPPRLSDVVAARRPSDGGTLAANAAHRATTPDKLRRTLRGDLDTIILKALKKKAVERYASVDALADDLRRYLNREPIAARPDTLTYRTARFLQRHASGVATAGAVLLLLTGLIWFYTARLTAERDRARLEADKATRVSELLSGLLTGADPYATRTAEPTVRGILDAGAERIETELAGQPELQAEMLTIVGRVYRRLGLDDKARPLLEKALAIARGLGPPDHPRTAQALNDLGVLLREKGDLATAGPMLEEALRLRRTLLGPEHTDVAITLVEVGRVYEDRGDDERAEPLFREALAIRRKVLGDEHRETSTSESALALVLWRKGDLTTAESLFRQSLTTSRKVLGESHPNVAAGLNNVGLMVAERGDHAAAEGLFRQALAIHRSTPGQHYRSVGSVLNNLGHALREQGRFEEAAAALKEALRITEAAAGSEDPSVATFTINVARVHLAENQPAFAEPLLRRALEMRRRWFREDDWRVASVKSLLGASLTGVDRYNEAEPLLLEAHAVLKGVAGPQGREATATRGRLAALYQALGQPEKAAALSPLAPRFRSPQ